MRHGCIVVAGNRQAARQAQFDDRTPVTVGVLVGVGHLFNDETVHFLVVHVVLAHVVLAVLGLQGKLTLAGRVVHHRDQLHQWLVHQIAKHAQGIRVADLAAQVQQVLGTSQACRVGVGNRLQHGGQLLHALAFGVDVADRQRVEHRGDARCDDLRIVADHRGHRRPINARTRRQVLFEVVGVQFHQPRQQVIALHVLSLTQLAASTLDLGNQAVTDHHSAGEYLLGRHHAGVTENLFVQHCSNSLAVRSTGVMSS